MLDTGSFATVPAPHEVVIVERSHVDRNPIRLPHGPRTGNSIDPFNNVSVVFESGLEKDWEQIWIADPEVAEVRAQQKLEIPTPDGKVTHFFDLLVFRNDGVVRACACRPRRLVGDLEQLLRRAADTVGDAFADDYVLLTEEGLSETRVANAQRVIDCARDNDVPAQQAIAAAAPGLGSVVRLAELDAIVGQGRRGSRAGIALIKRGVFAPLPGQRLDHAVALRNLFTN